MLGAHICSRKVEVAWGPNTAPLWPPSRSRAWSARWNLGPGGGGFDRVWLRVHLRCSYRMVGPGRRRCNRVTVRHQVLRGSGDAASGQTYVAWAVEVEVWPRGACGVIRRGFAFLALLVRWPAVRLRWLMERNRPISAMFCISKLIQRVKANGSY